MRCREAEAPCRTSAGRKPRCAERRRDRPGAVFATLGRRRDGSYTRLGHRATHDVAQDLRARLGARADIPEHLCNPRVLRRTFATRDHRQTRDLAGLQCLLGHADPKTTMVYVDDSPADRERLMPLALDEPTTLDEDRAG